MPETTGVQVNWPAIRKQLRANGDSFVHIVPALDGVKGCPPPLITDVTTAVETANTTMTGPDDQEIVWATDPTPTPAGAVINIDWVGDEEDQTKEWLDHFATALAAAGYAGAVKPAPRKDFPPVIGNNTDPHPTAYLAYTLTDPQASLRKRSWHIPQAVADQLLADAADWIHHAPGQDTYFTENAFTMLVEPHSIEDLLRVGIARAPRTDAVRIIHRPPSATGVGLAYNGMVAYDILNAPDPHLAWRATLPALKGQLLRHPADLDIAFIRSTRLITLSWSQIWNQHYPLPYLPHATAWEVNRHLWPRFAPDAHAIQILTPAHLERANDLSDWHTTALPGDRYLVETRDLNAWFDPGQAPDNVLAQARADFGAMILTMDDIKSNPHPDAPRHA